MPQDRDPSPLFTSTERDLGLDVDITRRDFLGATLLGAGMLLLDARAPLGVRPPTTNPDWEGYGGVGDYARSHGNMWATLLTAHALRDGKFKAARQVAVDTGETYDLIVVGGGISGLGAAAFFQQNKGGRVLVLDNQPIMGGEAKRNEFMVDGVHLIGPQGSNDFGVRLPQGWVGDYWKYLGLPYGLDAYQHQSWAAGIEPLPIARDNYLFQLWSDEFSSHGFFFKQPDGSLTLVRDAFGAGFDQTPWSPALRNDFQKWRSNPKVYGGPDLPRWLDGMTYEQLIVRELKLDPAVARYVDPILAGAAGGLGADVISAQCAGQIALPGTLNGAVSRFGGTRKLADNLKFGSSFPGGNDGIMRHVVKKLVPAAIAADGFAGILNGPLQFDAFDRPGSPTRIRVGATVIQASNRPDGTVEVLYVTDGDRVHRTVGRGVVLAGGQWVSQYLAADLPDTYRQAFNDFVRAPMLVVNVALRRWRFMYDLGITAASYRDQFGFCCNIRQPMIVGDYQPPLHPDKPIVLTFYVPFQRPGGTIRDQAVAARAELLSTTYRDYERQIREQLVRLFGRARFDPRADIAGIVLNRWGHAYVCPAPGFYYGRNDQPAAPDVLRQPFGRIAFANADLHGHQNWLDATAEGRRAAEQLATG